MLAKKSGGTWFSSEVVSRATVFVPTAQTVLRLPQTARAHPWYFAGALIVLGVIAYTGYSYWGNTHTEVRYVPYVVKPTSIRSEVTSSGQVVASNEITLTAKVSADVVAIPVKEGASVRAGTTIVQLDARTAVKAVRDAEANLASAQLTLKKLEQPPAELSILQAQNALTQAEQAMVDAKDSLTSSYESGFNTVSDAFLDLPTVMSGLDTLMNGYSASQSIDNLNAYRELIKDKDPTIGTLADGVAAAYNAARLSYDATFSHYASRSRASSDAEIEALIQESYTSARMIAEAVKKNADFLNHVNDVATTYGRRMPSVYTSHKTTLDGYTTTMSTHVSALLGAKNAIESAKVSIAAADRSYAEKTASLKDVTAGTDSIDLESQRIAVRQRENALRDARETLADYYIRAPFDGIVASIEVQRGERISGAVGTFISTGSVAEVTLNEVDIAQVSVGQKVVLTFDAIEDVVIEGEVLSVDTVGAVTQGVVSYGVRVGFTTKDVRIKPGMSVTAAITTAEVDKALVVPLTALKSDRNGSYVLVLDGVDASLYTRTASSTGEERVAARASAVAEGITVESEPRRVEVVTGIANDTHIEIREGLTGGEVVVSRTISTTTATTRTAQTSLFPTTGRPGGQTGTRTNTAR